MSDLKEILQRLPQAFLCRVIDRIVEIEKGKKAVGLKEVSIGEPYFSGSLPSDPVMPGVFILEALAQIGGVAFQSSSEKEEQTMPLLARIEGFRLRGNVTPGDQLILEAEVIHAFSHLARVRVSARGEGKIVAEGMLILAKGSPMDE